MTTTPDSEAVRQKVREGYGKIAAGEGSCCSATPTCCGGSSDAAEQLAQHIGYSAEELAALPDGANLGLSCGNPNALAALQAGEVVLDLGAGGGFDVFIAGRKVGPSGRAIGVDMTPEMLAKARHNIVSYRERAGFENVEFRLGEIEHLPVSDASVDVVISNCVLNLSPDKSQVWREIARVLKPGGRVAVSDIALRQALPPAILKSVEALVGCVAGAVLVSETERMAQAAGLEEMHLNEKSGYIDGIVDWQDRIYQEITSQLPSGSKPSDYITSLEVTARKPNGAGAVAPGAGSGPSVLQVYDPAMCCSTGVCGSDVDPALVQFAADVKWLQGQGVDVRRFNLSQNPAAFVENDLVKDALTETGEAALPALLVNGKMVASGQYPERAQLAAFCGLATGEKGLLTPAVRELIAIGAAVASNCDPCLRYHAHEAEKLGVTTDDIAGAVKLAAKVKDAPHRNVMRLAARLTQPESAEGGCCQNSETSGGDAKGGCCS